MGGHETLSFPRNVEAEPERFGRGWYDEASLDPEFRAGAVRIVNETGKPVAQIA
ncbi:hypothetical protein J5X84_15715 [Streptosporangiaceae bacterium NEAU-GS5]|nr:hypothetical protein [Streptosporangiaceae bacterium NEAU-GS5]